MKNNKKGFTLIELLAVILILGIIALIAIPTVNTVLQESRVGAWKSTGNQMAKQAESYYQLRVIKDSSYIVNFKSGLVSDGSYATIDTSGKVVYNVENDTPTNPDDAEKIMIAALEIKGDLPKLNGTDDVGIELFEIDSNGSAKLKFRTANAYCITTDDNVDDTMTGEEFNALTIKAGANVKCTGIDKTA